MTPSEVVHLVGGSRHPMVPLPGQPSTRSYNTLVGIHRILSHLVFTVGYPLLARVPSTASATGTAYPPQHVLYHTTVCPSTSSSTYSSYATYVISYYPSIFPLRVETQTHDLILRWHISRYHHIWGTPDTSDPEI